MRACMGHATDRKSMNDGGVQWYQQVGQWQAYEHEQEMSMANINDFKDSPFLAKSDFKTPKVCTIKRVERKNVAPENKQPEYKAVCFFEEYQKAMVFGKTNLQRTARALGSDETDDWIGKQIVVYTDPDVEFGGEVVGGLRVKKFEKPRPQLAQQGMSKAEQIAARNVPAKSIEDANAELAAMPNDLPYDDDSVPF